MSDVLIYDVSIDEERPVTKLDIDHFYELNAQYGRLITALREAREKGRALPDKVAAIVAEADARRDASMAKWIADLPQRLASYAKEFDSQEARS